MDNTVLEAELPGVALEKGWHIDSPRPCATDATGGQFSASFIAKHKDGRLAFVKVLDPTVDKSLSPNEQLLDLQNRLAIFNYETALLEKCDKTQIKRVVRIIGKGSMRLSSYSHDVHYVMLELAQNDLREHASLQNSLNAAFNMHIIHQTSVALEQLHFNQIAYQDLKPSNVLLFEELKLKLGDMGHAHDRGSPRPGYNGTLAGDPAYAPPEQLFGYQLAEWNQRRLATDMYLLGGLIVYMFTNVSLTALIAGQLRPQHHWDAWPDEFADVMPYLREAWNAALEEFSLTIPETIRNELVVLTRHLTDPDPLLRGHPRNRAGSDTHYGLRRFSSRFNVLVNKLDIESTSNKN